MNNVGKAGAIVTIIGSAIMTIGGIMLMSSGGLLISMPGSGLVIVLGVIMLVLGILNIVFSTLALIGKKDFITVSGIFAIISILLGWLAWVIPAILLLIGGILMLCGKKKEDEVTETNMTESSASVVDAVN